MALTLTEFQQELAHYAESQRHAGNQAMREGREDDAKRHADRMEAAEDGYFRVGDVEARDPQFMTTHQKLYHAAQTHGRAQHDADLETTDDDDD